jgi:hypothetical protein
VKGPDCAVTEQLATGVVVAGGVTLVELSVPDPPPPPQLINNTQKKEMENFSILLC